jgi:hypothetical protein
MPYVQKKHRSPHFGAGRLGSGAALSLLETGLADGLGEGPRSLTLFPAHSYNPRALSYGDRA